MDEKRLVQLNPLNNIKITKYFNYKRRLNGVYSRDNLPWINDGAYVINLDDKKGTPRVLLSIDRNIAIYFDSFGIEYIPLEVLSQIKDKLITHNNFRIQSDVSIISGFYCIAFIEYMIAGNVF